MNTFKSSKVRLLGIIAVVGVIIGVALISGEKEQNSTAEERIARTANTYEDDQATPSRVESVKIFDPLEEDATHEISEELLRIVERELYDTPDVRIPAPPPSVGTPLFSDVHEINRASFVRDSPDGRYLMYQYPGGLTYDSGVYVRDNATGEIREILDINSRYIGVTGFTWSDDSRSLTFIYEDTRKNDTIEVPLNKLGGRTLIKKPMDFGPNHRC